MSQRDVNGRFVKGHTVSKGKGRPSKKREERYYEILVSTVTFERWGRIVNKAAQQAECGDATARKWLADYIVGVPEQTQNVNIAGLPSVSEVVANVSKGGDENDV